MKVRIELEFDSYTPTTEDIIQYVNELGEDLDWSIENESKWINKRQVVYHK
jgi:hypothetical protein